MICVMRAASITAAVWSAAISLAGPGHAAAADSSGPAAQYLGEEVCRSCHVIEFLHWSRTVHARAFQGRPRTELESRSCESCHGPGSLHLQDPLDPSRIVAFTRGAAATPAQMNAMCLECHRAGPLIHWEGSVHEWQDLGCSDCHNPMTRTSARSLLRLDRTSKTCFSCHPQQRVEFRKRSHMPLFEGKISCADCHAPHGSSTDPLLKGDSVNDLCYSCHPEKRGPFIWEHAPVRESCLNCHRPHGSNHEMLLTRKPPFLCQECHAQLDDLFMHGSALVTRGQLDRDERLLNRSCTNCHAQIHGSNHPSGARFHR